MKMTKDVIELMQTCIDETLALIVVGGYMVGCFVGVEVPIEMPAGILLYYFAQKSK